jgi:outer membrane protein OmpU
MRKLLLGTTALAAAATLSANVALAETDVSITGGFEFTYSSQDSGIASSGSSFDKFSTDSDVAIKLERKTDSGLTIGMFQKLETTSDGASALASDETYLYINGGFGKLSFGQDDGAGDQLTRTAHDLVGPDALNDGGGAVLGSGNLSDDNADLIDDINDENAITYILPTMGGLTVGASYKDAGSGTGDNADETVVAAKYDFESGAVKGSIHYGANTIGGATAGAGSTHSNSMALDVSSGPFRAVIAKAEDDVTTAITTEVTDYGIQYNVGNGLTLAAVGTQVEENTGGETSDITTISAKYNLAAGLDAYFTYHDYDYEDGTTATAADDDGSWTQITIKATF